MIMLHVELIKLPSAPVPVVPGTVEHTCREVLADLQGLKEILEDDGPELLSEMHRQLGHLLTKYHTELDYATLPF